MTDPTKRQQLEVALERAGAQMANVMFNLEQKTGETITAEMADMMGNLRRDWDLAFGNLSQAVKLGAAPVAAVETTDLTRLRDCLKRSAVDGAPLTLSSSSCSALYYAMTTGQVLHEAAMAAPAFKERRRFEERG